MKTYPIILSIAALFTILIGCDIRSKKEVPVTISGKLMKDCGGDPAAFLELELSETHGTTSREGVSYYTTTDADGYFEFNYNAIVDISGVPRMNGAHLLSGGPYISKNICAIAQMDESTELGIIYIRENVPVEVSVKLISDSALGDSIHFKNNKASHGQWLPFNYLISDKNEVLDTIKLERSMYAKGCSSNPNAEAWFHWGIGDEGKMEVINGTHGTDQRIEFNILPCGEITRVTIEIP